MRTWVFLRGLTREARHWGAFPEVFRDAMPDARILALDLPGNGRLNGATSPPTVEALAAHVRGEVLRRGATPPYYLLGLSLGAMTAVAWAAAHPREIGACVLINTSLRPFSPFYRRLRPASYPALLRVILAGSDGLRAERTVFRLTSRMADEGVVPDWVRYRAEHPVSAANAFRQLAAASRFRAPETAPGVPLLLLCGARDALVSPRASHDIAAPWGCRLVEHPLAGHDLPLDDPRWVACRVRDWLTVRENSADSSGITPNDVSLASSKA